MTVDELIEELNLHDGDRDVSVEVLNEGGASIVTVYAGDELVVSWEAEG